jgi:hypothetical protein
MVHPNNMWGLHASSFLKSYSNAWTARRVQLRLLKAASIGSLGEARSHGRGCPPHGLTSAATPSWRATVDGEATARLVRETRAVTKEARAGPHGPMDQGATESKRIRQRDGKEIIK